MITDRDRPDLTQRISCLDTLIRQRLPGRYAIVFDTVEGTCLPSGEEEQSGLVLNEDGRVFSYWLGWDQQQGVLALVQWDEITPEPRWLHDSEYRHALECLGLDNHS